MTEQKDTRDINDIAGELSDRDFKVLLKAKQQAQLRVAQEPTAENVRTLNQINKALHDLGQQKKGPEEMSTPTLPNPLAVTEYLNDKGWKVSKSSVYGHLKEGKLKAVDGVFHIKDVEKYAALHLKRQDGTSPAEEAGQLQKEKLEAETRKAKAQAKHWEMKTLVESGQYIDRDLFNGELAARASIFRNDLETFFRSKAGEMVKRMDGCTDKTSDLVDYCLDQAEDFFGRYSEPKKWQVPRVEMKEDVQEIEEDEA
ncbi:hypothetical protein [Desulfoluna spongiiphila]|uniref:Uncharacterized protein n=1 Tax=Desulfoluna spongiiphila TaxID=419481 RepID=A0A1G5CH62_9BACT|nr:hypothetical protein [Desulfoluna spongiiphila]SCY01657.1 hypothetical protein SAMN05216233_10316 [Desulfoluna spongiiphila]